MDPHTLSGIINLDKPRGWTSFHAVARIRRLSTCRRVGHSGTLDPDASGVLPVFLGRAARLARFVTDLPKVYRAVIEFGSATATYDASGPVIGRGDPSALDAERIAAALDSFRGLIEQIPPMYSAIKHKGKPLYHFARSGTEIARRPRRVSVHRLTIIEWRNPRLTVEIECGKGTYIRSIAHDLGQALGCPAHLEELTRTRSGPFRIEESVSPADLEDSFHRDDWTRYLQPPEAAVSHFEPIGLEDAGERDFLHGKPLPLTTSPPGFEGEHRRIHARDGRFLGIARFDPQETLWRPVIVFS